MPLRLLRFFGGFIETADVRSLGAKEQIDDNLHMLHTSRLHEILVNLSGIFEAVRGQPVRGPGSRQLWVEAGPCSNTP